MTDPTQIARDVSEMIIVYFVQIDDPRREEFKDKVSYWIATALRDYGEKCVKDEKMKTDMMQNFYKVAIEQRDKADAVGYRRGWLDRDKNKELQRGQEGRKFPLKCGQCLREPHEGNCEPTQEGE